MLRPFVSIPHTLLLILSFFSLSLAAPAQDHEQQSRTLNRRADKPSQSQIDSANGMFPGIDWSYTAQNGECDSGQFAVLVEATRMALELIKFTGEDLRVAYDTTGFNRYFMKHDSWFKLRIFDFASQKYFGVYKWPTETPKRNLRQYKTAYYCTQPSWSSGCSKGTNPPAYTVDTKPDNNPPGSHDPTYPYSNSIVFCPRFWGKEFRYVNDITETTGRELKNIDDLHSYEHVLIHEWFHNRKNDVASLHVTDIKGDYGDGERNIYGSYASQHYAWRHVLKGGGVGDIEYHTMMNADSFAWMISYNWFKSIYNWRDDGSMKPLKKRQDEDPEEETDPYKDLPLDEDAVDDTTLTDPEDTSMPEATTYNRNDCPNCLITDGGCVAVPECRYPQDDGTVDPACTHCTCDVDKNDNSPSTEDVSLSDAKCAGWTGTLPKDYKWPQTTTPPDDFNCNCGESGCSADSAPCCANGSCACHCGESGCAKDDPGCCANGTCHFGTMRMLF